MNTMANINDELFDCLRYRLDEMSGVYYLYQDRYCSNVYYVVFEEIGKDGYAARVTQIEGTDRYNVFMYKDITNANSYIDNFVDKKVINVFVDKQKAGTVVKKNKTSSGRKIYEEVTIYVKNKNSVNSQVNECYTKYPGHIITESCGDSNEVLYLTRLIPVETRDYSGNDYHGDFEKPITDTAAEYSEFY